MTRVTVYLSPDSTVQREAEGKHTADALIMITFTKTIGQKAICKMTNFTISKIRKCTKSMKVR